ncbi:MAG: hydrogenase maturation nickel metallochaperone HypA [Pelolinea sp.]|nr:hydrogenase maturation nickel metallochaperone HypA [Pelolinea sp.]
MHELAVTESLLNTASEYAIKNNAQKVISLNITIGDLSNIIGDSVQFYWDMISEETICENSLLVFKRIPAKFLCQACGNDFEIQGELLPCPKCSSMDLKTIRGDEFLLESIEIEKDLEEKE